MRRVGTDARPAAESATSGVVWRGRAIRSCVFASFPLGAGGVLGRASMARRAHPGRCALAAHPARPPSTDPLSGGPRVRIPVSRVLIAWKGGTPGCGVRADRARGSGTQAHPVDGRGRARDRHVRRRDPAPHRDLSVRIHTGQSQLVRRPVDADRSGLGPRPPFAAALAQSPGTRSKFFPIIFSLPVRFSPPIRLWLSDGGTRGSLP